MPSRARAAADLGELGAVGGGAGGRRVDGPAGAVGVQRSQQAHGRQDLAQRRHDGRRTLPALHELGVEQVLGGVVHHDEQGQHGVRDEGQPGVATAVEVEQFTEARPGLAAPAVTAPRAALGRQARPCRAVLTSV